jgi:hypothetical protein
MMRDMDLIRELLLRLENLPMDYGDVHIITLGNECVAVEGHSETEVMQHLELLRGRDLIECPGSQPALALRSRALLGLGMTF